MKNSNKLLLALLVGFVLAILANNFIVEMEYEKMIGSRPSIETNK
jgi:hypothetical protein